MRTVKHNRVLRLVTLLAMASVLSLMLPIARATDELQTTASAQGHDPLGELWMNWLAHAMPERQHNVTMVSVRKLQSILKGAELAEASRMLDAVAAQPALIERRSAAARLVMQNAAWAAFDWLAQQMYRERMDSVRLPAASNPEWARGTAKANKTLRLKLARFIRQISLTREEIAALPANYGAPDFSDVEFPVAANNQLDLPKDLYDPAGPWLQVFYNQGGRIGVAHEGVRGTRSESLLFLRFPGGRNEGVNFIESFNKHAEWTAAPRLGVIRSFSKPDGPKPVVPEGTQLLLMARLLAVLKNGSVVPTPVIESIEFNQASQVVERKPLTISQMTHAAFRLSLEQLVKAEDVSLRRIRGTEPLLGAIFFQQGLNDCRHCHQSTTSVLSFNDGGFSRDAHRPVDLSLKVVANGSASRTPEFKMRSTVEYGLLRGMMESLP